jgi:hypothetical protein
MAGVRRAYDAVRSEPMGLKDDPLVSITPEQIDATAIARGGWKGLGDAEVPGSGSGLVKIIWRHGEESKKPVAERVTREDVMALPNVVRELQAESGAKEANRMWVRQRDDGEHVVYIDGPTDGGRRVLSIFVAKNKAEYPLSPNLGEGGSPGRVRSPAGDTAREPLGRLPESRDGNMPPQGRAVNFAKAAPEPAALPEPDARPARKADDPRIATIDDTTGLLDDAEALVATGRLSAEDAATLKAARQTLADTAAFDDGAAAAASCFRR